jgi:hypothetical protein
MLTILAVVARIVANPLSNVFQKQLAQRSAEPLFIIAATHGLMTAIALPLLLGRPHEALGVGFSSPRWSPSIWDIASSRSATSGAACWARSSW